MGLSKKFKTVLNCFFVDLSKLLWIVQIWFTHQNGFRPIQIVLDWSIVFAPDPADNQPHWFYTLLLQSCSSAPVAWRPLVSTYVVYFVYPLWNWDLRTWVAGSYFMLSHTNLVKGTHQFSYRYELCTRGWLIPCPNFIKK